MKKFKWNLTNNHNLVYDWNDSYNLNKKRNEIIILLKLNMYNFGN